MRTIKFRIWNKFLEKMSEPKKLCIDAELNAFYIDKPPHHDFELMQFTGLEDKNAKEIYEGDIVIAKETIDYNFKIIFKEGMFIGFNEKCEDFDTIYAQNFESFEVIGNIYENPELLEV